jgi:hypothetical protein
MTDAAEDDALERLRHDLGKAIVLQVTWLGPDPEPADLRDALEADLLETRRSPGGISGAVEVFAALRPALAAYESDPDRAALEGAMEEVGEVAAALRAGSATDADVDRGVRAARAVSDACRSLHRRYHHG